MPDIRPRLGYDAFYAHVPGARQSLVALSKAVDDAGFDKALNELMRLRVSQINGCAFCVGYHLQLLRKLDVPQRKLDLIAVWREVADFTAAARAALAWAEALTLMGQHHIPDGLYEEVVAVLGEATTAQLTVSVANINAWNRIAGTYRFTPPSTAG